MTMIQHSAQKKGAEANRTKALDRSRAVLDMVRDGKSHAEIAEKLNVKVGTVRTIVLRSRQRLGEPLRGSTPTAGTSEVVRVGQRPAGPMQDRRTKRARSRQAVEQRALFEDQA